jgi:transposase
MRSSGNVCRRFVDLGPSRRAVSNGHGSFWPICRTHRPTPWRARCKLLDAAYPADTAIEVILDNHSAHVSRETTTWLAAQPIGRFTFTFTPTHGSWLNLIEGFFSKLARSVLRHIRVSCKDELKERLIAFIGDINREPVVHTWRYKIDNAA